MRYFTALCHEMQVHPHAFYWQNMVSRWFQVEKQTFLNTLQI